MTGANPASFNTTRIVPCPRCGGDSIYASTNRFRPFCSERCKTADLGAWAAEDYRLTAQPKAGSLSENSDGEMPPTSDPGS